VRRAKRTRAASAARRPPVVIAKRVRPPTKPVQAPMRKPRKAWALPAGKAVVETEAVPGPAPVGPGPGT
jgi:hypothetical protein